MKVGGCLIKVFTFFPVFVKQRERKITRIDCRFT